MARKSDINFIASQKLVSKQNQSTSFEFILVISVIVLVILMGALYFMAMMSNQDLDTKINQTKGEITSAENNIARRKKVFAEFEKSTDANGDFIIIGVGSDGNPIYQYDGIEDVANSLAAELQQLKNAETSIKSQINFSSVIMQIIFFEADDNDATVNSIRFSGSEVTVEYTADDNANWDALLSAMKSSKSASGYDNTFYIGSVRSTQTTDTGSGVKFTITFTVLSDHVGQE